MMSQENRINMFHETVIYIWKMYESDDAMLISSPDTNAVPKWQSPHVFTFSPALDGADQVRIWDDTIIFSKFKEDNSTNVAHRSNGKPAELTSFGGLTWIQNGKAHRTDGPAFIYPDDDVDWFVNDLSVENIEGYFKNPKYPTEEEIVNFKLTHC